MASTQPPTDEQTRNCPDCGDEMDYDVIREHGTEFATTLYQGWWCSNCSKGMVHCDDCNSLHHPDFECAPKKKARLENAREQWGGVAEIPRYGFIDIDDCELIDDNTAVYSKDGRCPHCGGDLIFELRRNPRFAHQRPHPDPEYTAIAEYCSKITDGCSYRRA